MEGASEEESFIKMMNELIQLKSPFFEIFKKEKTDGSITAQLISGKNLK
jgi:hypothetical protein